jgi:hypothetical protein
MKDEGEMDTRTLEIGTTYFRITYADVARTMPGLEPLVYVGVDLFGPQPNGAAPKHYFQDTVSVMRFGLATGQMWGGPVIGDAEEAGQISGEDAEDGCYLMGHEAEEIGWVIVDLPAAIAELRAAAERAKELGYPKLEKAKGKWVQG